MSLVRVAVFSEIPTPYRKPIFDGLKRQPSHQFDFYFLARGQKDRNWGNYLDSDDHVLPGFQWCLEGRHTVFINRGVRQVLRTPYDVLVIGGYAQPAMALTILHAWKKKIPYVMMTESHLGQKRSWIKRAFKDPWVKKVYASSSANLVASTGAADYVRAYGAPEESVEIFPNTIDGIDFAKKVDQVRSNGLSLRESLGWKKQTVFLHVGFLNHRKGVDRLVEAFVRAHQNHPSARLLLVGEGDWKGRLQDRIRAANLEASVHFAGYIQPRDLFQYYAAADAFVLASRQEPFGAVVLEAMASGLPVIATSAVGAARDFVEHGMNGLIADSEPDLQRALVTLAEDPRRRVDMGRRSREKMEQWTHASLIDVFLRSVDHARKM